MIGPRPRQIGIAWIVIVGLMWSFGCERSQTSPQTEIQVGVHRIAVVPPAGWLHADHGREHHYQRGRAKISLVDLGAVDRDGFLEEVVAARGLLRRGQNEDAVARLFRLRIDRQTFTNPEDYQAYVTLWKEARLSGTSFDSVRLERVYDDLILLLEALPKSDVADHVMTALEEFGYDELRDIASRKPLRFTGRPAIQVDTWHRLNHEFRKRYLLVLNEGHLLVVHTAYGPFEECEEAFDRIVRSLTFGPVPAT
ncbi:hypothetical protein ACFL6M_01020 [Candidatus Eisenbacteria bacterium]|uniref:DUF1795 domain-containing protein n=1 Tax=Eiseniibacteriota bacterium TaxID=2212470 RepID=A0ABV6YIZ6_UNCEI